MIDWIYPEKESKLFSGRHYYLNLLKNNKENIKKNIGKNILLLGQKGIGKSAIVKEFIRQSKDTEFAFIDLEKISPSPELFAVEFIGNFLFWALRGEVQQYNEFLDISYLAKLNLPKRSKELISAIKNELEKIKPDQNLVLQSAFSFPAVFSEEKGKNIITCIRELQEIEALDKFEQVKNVKALFEKSIAGSAVIATSSDSAFCKGLKEFSIESVSYLDEQETAELAGKAGGKGIDTKELYQTTLGQPYYVRAVCAGLGNGKNVKESFIRQLITKEGRINTRCKELLSHYLSKARGKSLLFILLKVLSASPMRLSEIARKIYRSSPVTKSLLSRLIDVEVISLRNNIFSYNDPILAKYVDSTIVKNIEFDEEVPDSIMQDMIRREW